MVAATAKDKTWNGTDSATPNPVGFNFKHMLSKIIFTFKTQASKDYIMKVTDLKINGAADPASGAIVAATGTLTDQAIAWETAGTVTKGEYTFADIADYADGTQGEDGLFSKSTEARFVIPQNNENLEASFTVTVYNKKGATEANKLMEKDFTASVKYEKAVAEGKGTTGIWEPGFVYNYIAVINPDKVEPTAKPIVFTVTGVDEWTPANDNTLSPQEQQ